MLQKTRAIILHSIHYGDTSLIIHAFTEKWGRMAFLLKGARKSRKGNRSSMFQPLFLLDLDVYYKESRDLQWIKDANYIDRPPAGNQDITRSTQAIFISEVLMRTLKEEEANGQMFHFILNSIDYLNSTEDPSPSFHLLFLFKLTRYLGFYPMNNFSNRNEFFNTQAGSFSSIPMSADSERETQIASCWNSCFSSDYSVADQLFINKKTRNLFLNSLLEFYRIHLQTLNDLKSLEVLRTVYE